MKKLLVATTLALSLPLFTSAATVAELQAQLAALMAQLSTLPSQTTPQSGAASCPNLTRNLSRGMKGSDVTSLQQFLVSQKHLATDSATGFFGALTEGAVKQWQAKNGIASSGTPAATGYGAVGPKTRAALAKCITSKSSSVPTNPTSPTTASNTTNTTSSTSTNSTTNTNTTTSNTTTTKVSPLIVGPSSRVIVMSYIAEFNSLFNGDYFAKGGYHPLLASANTSVGYDSSDEKILDQHYAWLKELGVDAITAETTNNGPCLFGSVAQCTAYTKVQYPKEKFPSLYNSGSNEFLPGIISAVTATAKAMAAGTWNLYPAFSKRGGDIKLIPMIDGQDPGMYEGSIGQRPIDVQINTYYQLMLKYPELSVIYQGKPLLESFVGPLASVDQGSAARNSIINDLHALDNWKDKFTIRIRTVYTDSQPSLWSNVSGRQGLHEMDPNVQAWSDVERLVLAFGLFPSYTVAGDRVEGFTVNPAAPSTLFPGNPFDSSKWPDAWSAPDTMTYDGGVPFKNLMSYAQALNPIFLTVTSFNEYGGTPDQGSDEQHSNDIEPTKEWGYDKFNLVKQQLLGYKNGTLGAAPITHSMNRTDSNDVLDGYPASNAIDLDHTSFYSSKQFATDQNDRNTFLSTFVSNGPQTITRVMLRARVYQGVANGFPKSYTVYVTGAGGSGWVPVGDFTAQPDSYGVATVNLGGSYSTYAVLIIPKSLGTDANGKYFFQMAEVSMQ